MTVVSVSVGTPPAIGISQRAGQIAIAPTGVGGPAGPATEWRVSGGYVQWKTVGSNIWNNAVAVADLIGPMPAHSWSGTQLRFETAPGVWGNYVQLKGDTGATLELQVTATHIQWRPVGGGAWTNLYALADLIGPEGPAIELQVTVTHIQWRVVGDVSWINLIALADIEGPQGVAGPMPAHQVQNTTQIRFQNPDLSWGDWIETNQSGAGLATLRAMAVLGV